MTQTVIAQLSKAQVSNLVVVRSSQFRSIFFTYTCKHVSYLFDYWNNCIFRVFWSRITKQILTCVWLYGVC